LGYEVPLICLEQIPIADLWVRPAPALGVVTRFPEPENPALAGFSRFDGHSTFKACLVDAHATARRRHTHPPISPLSTCPGEHTKGSPLRDTTDERAIVRGRIRPPRRTFAGSPTRNPTALRRDVRAFD